MYTGKSYYLGLEVDTFYCDKCKQEYWSHPRRQRCLRKEWECPECSGKFKEKSIWRKLYEKVI